MQPIYVSFITRGGVTIRDDGPILQIQLVAQKKVQFNVDIKEETFFDMRDIIKRDTFKQAIYEMRVFF